MRCVFRKHLAVAYLLVGLNASNASSVINPGRASGIITGREPFNSYEIQLQSRYVENAPKSYDTRLMEPFSIVTLNGGPGLIRYDPYERQHYRGQDILHCPLE